MSRNEPTVVFIGGGPRTAGILERLSANAAHRDRGRDRDRAGTAFQPPASRRPAYQIHVVEPFQAGSGRIWRLDQDPGLMLNSRAADVTMFTDASVNCEGPAMDGPDLAQWAAALTAGALPNAPDLPPHLALQAAALTPDSFPTRQLHSFYLEWFFQRAVAALAPAIIVTVHRDTATEIVPDGDGGHVVRLATGTPLRADAVVLAAGHTDATIHAHSAEFANFALRHGGFHAAPAYTTDVDYSALEPGQDVIVSGMGLAFIDLVVLLMEGRGGRFTSRDDGEELDYVPSGREPRLWAGSRRGVPYHAKTSASLRGATPGPATFFTVESVTQLLTTHGELDFYTHLWPLIAKDTAHAYYQELFTGSPEHVTGDWASFEQEFAGVDWYSPAREALIATTVPNHSLRLEFETLDRPLAGQVFGTRGDIAAAVVDHIRHDLRMRDGDDHPETLALFLGLLRAYMSFASIVPADRLTAASHAAVHGWWHGFFSFVDSGPPPHRLRQLLAIHRAGLLEFLGPELTVRTDEATGTFVAATGATGRAPNGAASGAASGQDWGAKDADVRARAFIEARLPNPTVANSANPVLSTLHRSGIGVEQQLLTTDGTVSTGRLLVDGSHRVVNSQGQPSQAIFAIGPATSGWASGAFARPQSNAAPFRENDALARLILTTLTDSYPAPAEPEPAEPVHASALTSTSSSSGRTQP